MSTLQALFADRRLKCEKDIAEKEKAEKEQRNAEQAALKAKAEARKQAMLRDPKHPKAIQAKYAAEVTEQLEKDKRHREAILRRIEDDKIARRERQANRQTSPQATEKVAAVRNSRSVETGTWSDAYISETPRSLRDFDASRSQSPPTLKEPGVKQGGFPVTDIPDEVLRDAVLAKQRMRSTDLDTCIYLKRRFIGMKALEGMEKEHVHDLCKEGQKRAVVNFADSVVVESFATIFREVLKEAKKDTERAA